MQRYFALAGSAVALVALAACSDQSTAPTSPVTPVLSRPALALAATWPATSPIAGITAEAQFVTVCLAAGGTNATFTATKTAAAADLTTGSTPPANFNLTPGTCTTIFNHSGIPNDIPGPPVFDFPVTIGITRTSANGLAPVSTIVVAPGGQDGCAPGDPAPDAATGAGTAFVQVCANNFHGALVTFVTTPPVVEQVCDRYTFGGWVNQKPNHISYGVNAGLNDAGLAWGDFEINNHANGDKIHVWNVTAYGIPASGPLAGVANARFASGPAEVNGEAGHTAELRFVDNGEPGTDDRIWLAVDGSQYFPLQNVQGGNIQLHDQCKKAPKDEKH